jgi:hypothetical protein
VKSLILSKTCFLIFIAFKQYLLHSNNIYCIQTISIYRWYNLIRTCACECDWLFHWQHKLCATCSANVNINYHLPIKVYYRICTLRRISFLLLFLFVFYFAFSVLHNGCLMFKK